MEKRLSQKNLQEFLSTQKRKLGKAEVERIATEKRSATADPAKHIFLCHCHSDKTIVGKIKVLFNKIDATLYVYWMHNALPPVTDQITARSIRDRIEESNRFLFLATAAAINSKWCNWELGLAYSLKEPNQLAVLPIESRSGRWRGSEYLKLYPEMVVGRPELELLEPENIHIKQGDTIVPLLRWLIL